MPTDPGKMTLLITGASGFIGCYLSKLLARQGFRIRAIGRVRDEVESARVKELADSDIDFQEVDLTDPGQAKVATHDVDAVIHLAAAQHEAEMPDSYFFAINVDGTRNILKAATDSGADRFIYISTIGIFGVGGPDVLNESSPPHPNNAYGRSKLAAENLVRTFNGDMKTTIIRIGEAYGEGDFRLLKLFKAAEKNRLLQIGDGSNLHQPIHVDDVAKGILAALTHDNGVGEIFLLAGKEKVTTAAMLRTVDSVLDAHAHTIRIPLQPMRAVCIVCESVFSSLGKRPPLHRRRLEFFTKNLTFDTTKIQTELGFSPEISFEEGCRRTADWYRSHGFIH